ncbi:MAG: hypothetical protein M4579_007332 [Chaenotheca gracillima]|nr:MAG: hypothetical protein M4579_007332 [Chaenotheca gracillima]
MSIKFNPREAVTNWSDWIKCYARKFQGWEDRKDIEFILEDKSRRAWAGTVTGSLPPVQAAIEDSKLADVQMLLTEIDSKSRMVFVLPIINVYQSQTKAEQAELQTEQRTSLSVPTESHRLKRRKSSEMQEITVKEEPLEIKTEVKTEEEDSIDQTGSETNNGTNIDPVEHDLDTESRSNELRRTGRKRVIKK